MKSYIGLYLFYLWIGEGRTVSYLCIKAKFCRTQNHLTLRKFITHTHTCYDTRIALCVIWGRKYHMWNDLNLKTEQTVDDLTADKSIPALPITNWRIENLSNVDGNRCHKSRVLIRGVISSGRPHWPSQICRPSFRCHASVLRQRNG